MKHLLAHARDEIRELRRCNEILGAKVEVMELFACVLHTTPAHSSVGMSEDVAWKLQKAIDQIEKEQDDAHQRHSGGRTEESRPSGNGG